jgi:hypothetical protein
MRENKWFCDQYTNIVKMQHFSRIKFLPLEMPFSVGTYLLKLKTVKYKLTAPTEPSGSHLWSVPARGRLTPKSQQACRSP